MQLRLRLEMAHKAAHHSGARYQKAARWIKQTCSNDPQAVCTCGRTLNQHPLGVNGKPQTWTAGHGIPQSTTWKLWTNTHQPAPPGDWLAPETSRCNKQHATEIARQLAKGFWNHA